MIRILIEFHVPVKTIRWKAEHKLSYRLSVVIKQSADIQHHYFTWQLSVARAALSSDRPYARSDERQVLLRQGIA